MRGLVVLTSQFGHRITAVGFLIIFEAKILVGRFLMRSADSSSVRNIKI